MIHRHLPRSRRLLFAIAAAAVIGSACGGGDGNADPAPTTTPPPSATTIADDQASTTTQAPAEDFDIASIEASVVRITSEGTFVDPADLTSFSAAGVGTGFIIDADGTVVTNNHVVTGAGLLRVFVAGSPDPVNARVLGVSECSDLAVIDLEGDGYTPLEWRAEEVQAGLDVYAAGYPLTTEQAVEDTDYTLTRGIVSSTRSDGETPWASVDAVLEHDARIRGGNSGGPLVDEMGRVVAVNYAGLAEADQNFAIAASIARPVVEQLRSGVDVDSIGVNGQALSLADLSGIFVASVESGSPADDVGVRAGDVITRLEGLPLGTEGTMSTYCDVLRTNSPSDVLAIEVLRPATQEVFEGRLNGDPLELSFSLAQEFDDQVESGGGSTGTGGGAYTDYTSVQDDTGVIAVDVPASWSQTDGSVNTDFGPSIYASPDLGQFVETFNVPGVIVEASTEIGADQVQATVDAVDFSGSCVDGGRQPYEDPVYTGLLHVWADCGGVGTVVIVVAATPPDGSYVIRLLIQAVEERDLAAADRVLETFLATF